MAGMPVPTVDKIIKAAGGRPNAMDLIWPAGTLGRCYEFGPHTAIAVSGLATDNGVVVAHIAICRNTEKPKAERRWKPVVSLDLYPGQCLPAITAPPDQGVATASVSAPQGQFSSAAAVPLGATANPKTGLILLNYSKCDVGIVIELYRQLIGKKIVYDRTVQGPVTLVEPKPVSRQEAIVLIEQVLFANAFWMVDTAPDAVELGGASQNPRQFGVPIYSSEQEIPQNERVITYVLKLKHRDPQNFHGLMSQYVAPSPFPSLLCDPASHACVLTERRLSTSRSPR